MCMSSAKVLNSSPSQHEALCVLAHLTRGHLSLKTPLSDLSPSFSLTLSLYKLISLDTLSQGKHGVSLTPHRIELSLLLFADDLKVFATTVTGLQNQLNTLHQQPREFV